jgi:hypothetical protein
LHLSGYVFKKGSPSCGIERVRIHNEHGKISRNGVGLFARAFIEQFPLIPVEEEGRLCDPTLRENFIERVFCYRRWQDLVQSGVTGRPWCGSIRSTNICYWPITRSNARCSGG